jgi:predicted aldo/keto reductase-like oxidoreductase
LLSCSDLASKNCKNKSVYVFLVSLCVFNNAQPTKQIVSFNLTFVWDEEYVKFCLFGSENSSGVQKDTT